MRLAIHLRMYEKGKIGGMENYVRHILRGIGADPLVSRDGWTIFGLESELEHIREFAPTANLIGVTYGNKETVITRHLDQNSYDLFFCPLLVLNPLHVQIPSAITMPDVQHEYFPEFFDKTNLEWRRRTYQPSVFYADTVFTISEYSKSTIVDRFRVDPAKIVVVGMDVDPEFRCPPGPEAHQSFLDLAIPQPYIYFPANFWGHKNHWTLFRALKLLMKDGYSNLTLALTGAPTTGLERVKAEVNKLKLTRSVRFLGYQPREVVAEIYRHSLCLAFVSIFEGFGIPILEAFHVGTPVVASGGTSCAEVIGDAGVLVREQDAAHVAAGIRKIIEDPELRRDLVQRGRQRISKYSWDETITATLRSFETTIQQYRRSCIEVCEYPLVSIVTQTYNRGSFLEETIQSIVTQDYPKVELIVMDRGSADGTLDILHKHRSQLQYRSERDCGQAQAFNRGFGLSSGKVITFLNAGDTYLPGAVSTAVRHLITNKDVGLVYGDAYHVTEDGSTIESYQTEPYDDDLLMRKSFICQPAAFMWRNVVESVGLMNEELQTALDYDLWIRIARRRPLLKVHAYLATARVYGDKTTSRRRQTDAKTLRMVREHYGFVPYDWVYRYVSHLIDHTDNGPDASRPTASARLLALLLGSWLNGGKLRRYWREWRTGA